VLSIVENRRRKIRHPGESRDPLIRSSMGSVSRVAPDQGIPAFAGMTIAGERATLAAGVR